MVGLFSVYTPLPNPSWIRLKEPALAGYIYNPSKAPFEKGGFFVALWQPCCRRWWAMRLRGRRDQ